MVNLFIFGSRNRAMRYGIGTYVSQLTAALIKYTETTVYIVNYYTVDYKEFSIQSIKPKLWDINIPAPVIGKRNEKNHHKYASRIVDLLFDFISGKENVVFQLNYVDSVPIVKNLKSRFANPVISVVHSTWWQYYFSGNKRKLIELLQASPLTKATHMNKFAFDEKKYYEQSDRIVSVTKYMKNFLEEHYGISGEKISVVPNGFESGGHEVLDENDRANLKRELGFNSFDKIVLFSGRLDKNKGLYPLLDGFMEALYQEDNMRLVIIGEDSGPDKICDYLKHIKNIYGKITFTGFLEYEIVLKFYQIADIGIIPSIYDHCPYVALEMMAYNIPMIVSNTEGLNEIFGKNQVVFLEPVFDNEGYITFSKNEIAEAIVLLLRDKLKVKQITEDYQKLIGTFYSGHRMAEDMYSILLKALSKRC